jgi:hypothetical protein
VPPGAKLGNSGVWVLDTQTMESGFHCRVNELLQGNMQPLDGGRGFRGSDFRKLRINGSQSVVKTDRGIDVGNLFDNAIPVLGMDNLHPDRQVLKSHSPDFRHRAEFWQLLSVYKFKLDVRKRYGSQESPSGPSQQFLAGTIAVPCAGVLANVFHTRGMIQAGIIFGHDFQHFGGVRFRALCLGLRIASRGVRQSNSQPLCHAVKRSAVSDSNQISRYVVGK